MHAVIIFCFAQDPGALTAPALVKQECNEKSSKLIAAKALICMCFYHILAV